jgi:hypothetical protein
LSKSGRHFTRRPMHVLLLPVKRNLSEGAICSSEMLSGCLDSRAHINITRKHHSVTAYVQCLFCYPLICVIISKLYLEKKILSDFICYSFSDQDKSRLFSKVQVVSRSKNTPSRTNISLSMLCREKVTVCSQDHNEQIKYTLLAQGRNFSINHVGL